MGAMYRLKAYFGMVPADEMDTYLDEPSGGRYAASRRSSRDDDERWDDRRHDDDEHDEERRPSRSVVAPRLGVRGGSGTGSAAAGVPSTRGALAIDPDPVRSGSRSEPVVAAVPEQRSASSGRVATPSRITTVHPRSYNEARAIGERYREGVPVIMNLTELDDAAAKRLVDFAAGLAFALRGSIDKVTNRVFLLTPVDVEVSADQARRLAQRSAGGTGPDDGWSAGHGRVDAERGFFGQD